MNHRTTLSLVLTLSVLLSLVSFPSTAQGQQPSRLRFDSGILSPNPNQILRITLGCGGGNYCPATFRITWLKYMAAGCNADGVCRHTVESQGATAPAIVSADETVSYDIQGTGNGVRAVVESNRQNVRVVFQIINALTGEVVAVWHPFGDF